MSDELSDIASMPSTPRNAAEQAQWDALFQALVVDCVRRLGFSKAMGCLHLAREIADQALAARRDSVSAGR